MSENNITHPIRDRIGTFLIFLMYLAIIAITLGEILAPKWWVGELLVSFRPHLALSSVISGVFAAFFGFWRAGLGLALLSSIAFFPLTQTADPADLSQENAPIRFLSANICGHENENFDAFLAMIELHQPDVIGVLEVSASWKEMLETQLSEYPHQTIIDRPDNFGIAVLSKHPYSQIHYEPPNAGASPLFDLTIEIEENIWHTIIAHPVPPIGAQWWNRRNQQLNSLATLAANVEHTVLMADLNTTASSPTFRRLLQQGQLLKTSENHLQYAGTFPSSLGRFGLIIDHILVSQDIALVSHAVLPPIGSDHRPVLVELIRKP